MPDVMDGESEKEFIARCIEMVMEDGTASDNDQAAAVCYSMWEEHMEGKTKAESLEQQMSAVNTAFREQYPYRDMTPMDYWVVQTFDDYVVVECGMEYYKVPYTLEGEKYTFAPRAECVQ